MSVASPVDELVAPEERRVAERVHRAVAPEQPVAVVRARRRERDDRRRDRPAAERTEEAGVAEREHAAVLGDDPVAAPGAGRDDADHRAGEEPATHRAEERRRRRTRRRRRRTRRTSSRAPGRRRRHAQRGPVEPQPARRAVERGVAEREHAAVAGQEPVAGRWSWSRRCRRSGRFSRMLPVDPKSAAAPAARTESRWGMSAAAGATDNPTVSDASTTATSRERRVDADRVAHVRTRLRKPSSPSRTSTTVKPISAPYTATSDMCGMLVNAARNPSLM